MPGISIVRKADSSVTGDLFKDILKQNAPFDYFESVIAFESDDIIIGYDTHSSYPIDTFDYEDYCIVFEGRIYDPDQSDIKSVIIGLLPYFFSGTNQSEDTLSRWLQNTDGDFLIAVYDKKNRKLAIINDIFRRLPYYFHKEGGRLIISRNLKFVTDCLPGFKFDRLGLTQYLVFFYLLGDRTFIESVSRSSVAMLLNADISTGQCNCKNLYAFDFSIKKHKHKSVKENATRLAELFLEGVKNRVGTKNIISQSGGMDSRSVAAALAQTGADVEAATWKDVFSVSELDTTTAAQIAKTLGMKWNLFELQESKGSYMLDLLKINKATAKLSMPHTIQYLSLLREKFGRDITFFNGDGGDRIMGSILPNKKHTHNMGTLIEYILNFDGPDLTYLGLDNALKLTGISKKVFLESLRSLLDSYPEKSPADKFVHYNIFGQSFNWHHCSNDKIKSFFWNLSPFWSTKFMLYSMNCPHQQKKYMHLYANFLDNLNDKLLDVPYANNKAKIPTPITNNKSAIYHFCKVLKSKPNPIRFVLKKIAKLLHGHAENATLQYRQVPAMIKCMEEQMSSDAIEQYLSKEVLSTLIKESSKYKRETFASIFTVTTLLEYYSTGKTSIEKYKKEQFDCYE